MLPHDKKMNLWVDDVKAAPEGWAVARTYDDAMKLLARYDYVTVALDHDLGDDGNTGYDILCAMERGEVRTPERLMIISLNPVGAARMKTVAERLGIYHNDTEHAGDTEAEDDRFHESLAYLESEYRAMDAASSRLAEKNVKLRARLEQAEGLLHQANLIMGTAWLNGVCPEGAPLDGPCERCPSPCNVYREWLADTRAFLTPTEDREDG